MYFYSIIIYIVMKSFFKFTLLAAIIIIGKMAKQQPSQAPIAQRVKAANVAKMPVVMARETTTMAPVKSSNKLTRSQQTSSGIITELY